MLAAHMDEIGLIVTKVEASFLHVAAIGGVDPRSVLCQEVTVYPTGPGSECYPGGLSGYIGSRPPHVLSASEREQVIPLRDLRVDLGQPASFFSGGLVRVGDRVAIRGPTPSCSAAGWRPRRWTTGRAWRRCSARWAIWRICAIPGTSSRWQRCRRRSACAARSRSAFGLAPDLAIAIDVTFGATPGVNGGKTVAMDKGPAIGWGPNLHPGVVRRLREAADALEIPYVTEPLPGQSGTDAWALQVTREGIPTGLLSIPIRYMHTAVETVVLADIDRTARLLAAFISRLDDAFLGGLAEEV